MSQIALQIKCRQVDLQVIEVLFNTEVELSSALLAKTNYSLAVAPQDIDVMSVQPIGEHNWNIKGVYLTLNKPWAVGGITLTVTYSSFIISQCQGYTGFSGTSVAKKVEPLPDKRYFFIDIEGVPEGFPSAPSIDISTLASGYNASIVIPCEYIQTNTISTLGQKLVLDQGTILNDNLTITLNDFDGRLQSLFSTENASAKTMIMWQTQSGSAFASSYLRHTTEANQNIRLLAEDNASVFSIGEYIWINGNTLKIIDRTSVGTFEGQDLYEYEVQTLINTNELYPVTGRMVAKNHPPYFDGRWFKLYEYCESRYGVSPKCIYTGIMSEPEIVEINGAIPISWRISVKDFSTRFLTKGPSKLAVSDTVNYIRFSDVPFKVRFVQFPISQLSYNNYKQTYEFRLPGGVVSGGGGFTPSEYLQRIDYLLFDTSDGNNTYQIDEDSSYGYWYARWSSTVNVRTYELPGEALTPEAIAYELSDILFWDGTRFIPKLIGGIADSNYNVQSLNENIGGASYSSNTSDLQQYILIPMIKRMKTATERGVDISDESTYPDDLTDSTTAKFLETIGWKDLIIQLESISEDGNSSFKIGQNGFYQVFPDFDPEPPTYNIATTDGASSVPRFLLDRNPARTSTTLSATMNDDLDFSEIRRGFDKFTNKITASSEGYFIGANSPNAGGFYKINDWKGMNAHSSGRPMIGVVESTTGIFYDYIDATTIGNQTKPPESGQPIEEYIHVGYMARSGAYSLINSNPIEWLRSYLTSTGRGTNGSYDTLPGTYSLGISTALIDATAFDEAQALSSPYSAWGVIDRGVNNVWNKLGQSLCLPLGYFLCCKRDGTITLRRITKKMEHEDIEYQITDDDILATQIASEQSLENSYDSITLKYNEKYLPPTWKIKDFTVIAADGLKRASISKNLAIDSFVSCDQGLLTHTLQRRILPLLKRPNIQISIDLPDINSDGVKFFELIPGDIIYLDSVSLPSFRNTSTISGQFIVMETKYDIVKGIVSVQILSLNDDLPQRGLNTSARVINVNTGANKVTVLASNFGSATKPNLIDSAGQFKVRYNNAVELSSDTISSVGYTANVLSKNVLTFEIEYSGTLSNYFDVVASSSSSTNIVISGDARKRYWAGKKILTDNTVITPSANGYTISSVTYGGGNTTITLSDAMTGSLSNGDLIWTDSTYVIATEANNADAAQLNLAYLASGYWKKVGSRWATQPLVPKVNSSKNNVAYFV